MGYFSENYAHGAKFKANGIGLPFAGLKDVVTENGMKVIPVKAVFTYDAKYGTRSAIFTGALNINLPDHCLSDVQKILGDQKAINLINEGKVGFLPSTYEDSKGETRYSGKFVDM